MTPDQRLATFQRFVEAKPDDAFARYSLAMALRSAGHGEEAVAQFQEIARRRPEYVPTYLMLGQVLEALGRDGEAARAYRDGIAVASKPADGHARSELEQALAQVSARGARPEEEPRG